MAIRKSNGHIRQVEFKAQATPRLKLWPKKKIIKDNHILDEHKTS